MRSPSAQNCFFIFYSKFRGSPVTREAKKKCNRRINGARWLHGFHPKDPRWPQLPVKKKKKSRTGTPSAKVVLEKERFIFGGKGGEGGLKFQNKDFLIWPLSKSVIQP